MASTNGVSAISNAEDFHKTEFDYVICGGGTAGLTIAARLTENPNVTVGVIEAGKYRKDDMFVDTPALFLAMLGNTDYDWNFRTTPQEGNNDIIHHLPRGKLLGGSSGINYMMFVKPSLKDYDDWAELAGDNGWNAKNMVKYQKRLQTLEKVDDAITDRSNIPFAPEFHGTDGPVKTSFNDTPLMPIEEAYVKAADETFGYRKPRDPWSGDHIGFFSSLGSVVRSGPDRGKRSYAGRGYFGLAKDRPNFKVLCEAMVNKINLEGDIATGVTFSQDDKTYEVKAKREIIVCGGAIQSPQILELSGIGDPEVLQAAGVECKIENKAVGRNFQDHSVTGLGYKLQDGVVSSDAFHRPEIQAQLMKQYMETQGGPLSGIASVQGFFPYKACVEGEALQKTIQSIRDSIKDAKTDFEKRQLEQVIKHLEDDKSANLQLLVVPATGDMEAGVSDQRLLYPPADTSAPMGVTLVVALQYPASRGSVHITSADVHEHPRIDPGYLRHPADVEALAAGVQMLHRISQSAHVAPLLRERYTPKPHLDLQEVEQARTAVRTAIMGEYHACGSVAMGDALDSRLRVKGVRNVRVADASIFPNNVSGNICSSVYAVGEKAADLIKEDFQ